MVPVIRPGQLALTGSSQSNSVQAKSPAGVVRSRSHWSLRTIRPMRNARMQEIGFTLQSFLSESIALSRSVGVNGAASALTQVSMIPSLSLSMPYCAFMFTTFDASGTARRPG